LVLGEVAGAVDGVTSWAVLGSSIGEQAAADADASAAVDQRDALSEAAAAADAVDGGVRAEAAIAEAQAASDDVSATLIVGASTRQRKILLALEGLVATAVAALGSAIAADRTLGGLVDWLEASSVARRDSRSSAGIASFNWVTVPLTVEWRADTPLAA
jgi:hypothetical protein